jgi:PBSX family phage terminase large subunit
VKKQIAVLPKQMEFLTAPEKYCAYIGGFGSGKTYVLCMDAAQTALRNPGAMLLVGAITYPLLRDSTMHCFFNDVWPSIMPWTDWRPFFHKAENRLTLPNGTTILFRNLDEPRRVTNLTLDGFWIDEAIFVPENTFLMLQGRLRGRTGPRTGRICGNPPYPLHWIDMRFAHADTTLGTYRYISAPTTENYLLPEGFVDDLIQSFGIDSQYGKRFILGKIVAMEGAVWPDLSPEDQTVTDQDIRRLLDKPYRIVSCIDFGASNPFCCSWHMCVNDPDIGVQWIVLDTYKSGPKALGDHATIIRHKWTELQKKFDLREQAATYADHDAQDRIELSHMGINTAPARKKDKMLNILLCERLIHARKPIRFAVRDCKANEEAWKEMLSYRYQTRELQAGSEKNMPEEPVKFNDHFVDTLLMSVGSELPKFDTRWERLGKEYETPAPAPAATTLSEDRLYMDTTDIRAAELNDITQY